jgi:membrane-bound inhibitor of C-type lysozyme
VIIRSFAFIAALGLLVAPAAAQSPAPMKPVPKKVHLHYSCQGLTVKVTYDNVKDKAIVTYGNRPYGLPHVPSADGARYMNDKLEWWEKGPTATLTSVADGKADTLLATCAVIKKK